MKLGRHEIGPHRTFIIAEAGTNFAGDTEYRRETNIGKYIQNAERVGVDAIKFQIFYPNEPLFCPIDGDETRWTRWNQTLLPLKTWRQAKVFSEQCGLVFLASAFQPAAVQWLKELGVEAYKVASRARDTYPYDSVPGPFIVSCRPPSVFQGAGDALVDEAWPIQCTPQYPTPWSMDALWNGMGHGLSDHTGNIWAGLHAITHGASMLEVHFSIHDDKRDAGNDALVCLTTAQLKFLAEARDAFASLRSD